MNDTDLRWQLRQLPRELDPAHDLWPGIAARLQPQARRPVRAAWIGGLAIAASLLVAVVLWRGGGANEAAYDPGTERIVQAEAQAMTLEYQAALAQYQAVPVPPALVPGIAELDRSVIDIRTALAADPDSVPLLQQLQRTYALRLSLTQRAALG